MELIYRNRHAISWFPALLVGIYLLLLSSVDILKVKPKYEEKAIEISLAEPLPEPKPAEPMPKTVEPQPVVPTPPLPAPVEPEAAIEQIKPKPKLKKVEEQKPKPVNNLQPVQKKTKPEPQQDVKSEPKPETKTEATKPELKSEAKSEPKPAVQPEPKKVEPAPKPTASVSSASAEASYLAKVRGAVEAQKRYPTGREASLERPEGSVEVWLEVDRSGKVLSSGISNKAKSMLLNRAATNSLQSIQKISPFPADAFVGSNTKKFTATLNYQAP
ncbi:energy transducer TonB [Acinetobacter brisouii]|uniref:energy transducer TonB n=1 Tax=Acinetobacter brisouii TaxID=396323 RepID=UPI00124F80D8|nr:energy transducer TonB [Acinetobacter brisouii]